MPCFLFQSQPSYGTLISNSSSDPVPLGLTKVYTVLLKIARGDTAHVKINVTATDPAVHVCTVRAFTAGNNLPCVADETSKRTYEYWPDKSGYQSVKTDLGIITNFGKTGSKSSSYGHCTTKSSPKNSC